MYKNTSNILFKTCWTPCKKPHFSMRFRSWYTFFLNNPLCSHQLLRILTDINRHDEDDMQWAKQGAKLSFTSYNIQELSAVDTTKGNHCKECATGLEKKNALPFLPCHWYYIKWAKQSSMLSFTSKDVRIVRRCAERNRWMQCMSTMCRLSPYYGGLAMILPF